MRIRSSQNWLVQAACFAAAFGFAPAAADFVEVDKYCTSPDRTVIRLDLGKGNSATLVLLRTKEARCLQWCVSGTLYLHFHEGYNRKALASGQIVEGGFFLDELNWTDRDNGEGPLSVVKTIFKEGLGHGITYKEQGNNTNFTAQTLPGCARWPDGPNPIPDPVTAKLPGDGSRAADAINPPPRMPVELPRSVDIVRETWPETRLNNPSDPVGAGRPAAAQPMLGTPVPNAGIPTNTAMMPSHNRAISIMENRPPPQVRPPVIPPLTAPVAPQVLPQQLPSGGGAYLSQPNVPRGNMPASSSVNTGAAIPGNYVPREGSIRPAGNPVQQPAVRPVPNPVMNPGTSTISNARPGSVSVIQNQNTQTVRTIDYERMRKKRLQQQRMDFDSIIK